MKKNIMLGVNSKTNTCCELHCLLSFDELIGHRHQLEASDFTHRATNWCGRDECERTLSIIKMKLTGRKIVLNKNIVFNGSDFDMGHEYPWKFEIDEIHELTEVKDEKR